MCSYARKKRRRIGLGLKKGRGREVEGGWKGLGSSTCFLQAAYRAPFSSQHAGGSYVLRPCASYALPRPFSFIPLPSLASGLQHSTVVSAALHSQAEADKSMLAFNLTRPRERTTKLKKKSWSEKKWISFASIPSRSFFCDPRTVVFFSHLPSFPRFISLHYHTLGEFSVTPSLYWRFTSSKRNLKVIFPFLKQNFGWTLCFKVTRVRDLEIEKSHDREKNSSFCESRNSRLSE